MSEMIDIREYKGALHKRLHSTYNGDLLTEGVAEPNRYEYGLLDVASQKEPARRWALTRDNDLVMQVTDWEEGREGYRTETDVWIIARADLLRERDEGKDSGIVNTWELYTPDGTPLGIVEGA